jgi:hypothetical protein
MRAVEFQLEAMRVIINLYSVRVKASPIHSPEKVQGDNSESKMPCEDGSALTSVAVDPLSPTALHKSRHRNHRNLSQKTKHFDTCQLLEASDQQAPTMCKYYAHTHPCGHTKTVWIACLSHVRNNT